MVYCMAHPVMFWLYGCNLNFPQPRQSVEYISVKNTEEGQNNTSTLWIDLLYVQSLIHKLTVLGNICLSM